MLIDSSVISVTKETPDTVTLRLAAGFPNLAGQFIMIAAQIEGRHIKRSYSISGSDASGSYVEITVKRQDPGIMSSFLQTVTPGTKVTLHGPFGKQFLIKPSNHVVIIAGGSGIAPFRRFLQERPKCPVTLFYSVKTSNDIIFNKELHSYNQKDYRLIVTLTQPGSLWRGSRGRISSELLAKELENNFSDKEFYVCGPTPMVVDVQNILSKLGIAKEHVHTEKFGLVS